VHLPANGQTLFFPSPHGAFVPLQIGGNFLPGVQALGRSFTEAVWQLRFGHTHEEAFAGDNRMAPIVA
jgi:hypothetical protein